MALKPIMFSPYTHQLSRYYTYSHGHLDSRIEGPSRSAQARRTGFPSETMGSRDFSTPLDFYDIIISQIGSVHLAFWDDVFWLIALILCRKNTIYVQER